jgi:hypothetical protein
LRTTIDASRFGRRSEAIDFDFAAGMLSRSAVRTNAVQREGASTVSINHPLAAYFGRTEQHDA